MKYLVTGGAGFIGSHLVEGMLAAGHEIVVIDTLRAGDKLPRSAAIKVDFHRGDVCDADLVSRLARGCTAIFHFAAVVGVDVVADHPLETMDTEYHGLVNVARAAVRQGVERIIYASTSGVYGDLAESSMSQEVLPPAPCTSYGVAKRFAEVYLDSLYREKGIHSASLRMFNVYGPRQDERMVVPRFLQRARAGDPIVVFGTGEQTRDFTYIDDVVRSILAIAERTLGAEIFNISKGEETRIVDLARKIIKILDSPSIIETTMVPAHRIGFEVQRRTGAANHMLSRIGFLPCTSLDEGLRRTAAYFSAACL